MPSEASWAIISTQAMGSRTGCDPYFKRILLTVKNKMLVSQTSVPPVYQNTQAFINTLTPGVSIVMKDGRLQRFLGVNANPSYMCQPDPTPSVQNYVISIPDNTPIGNNVLQASGLNVDDFYIISGNTAGAFSMNAPTGELSVAGPLNYHTLAQYVLQCSSPTQKDSTTFYHHSQPTATICPLVVANQGGSYPRAFERRHSSGYRTGQ